MISIPMKARPVVTAATPRGSRAHGRIANKLFGIGEQANQFTHERNGLSGRCLSIRVQPSVGYSKTPRLPPQFHSTSHRWGTPFMNSLWQSHSSRHKHADVLPHRQQVRRLAAMRVSSRKMRVSTLSVIAPPRGRAGQYSSAAFRVTRGGWFRPCDGVRAQPSSVRDVAATETVRGPPAVS